MLSEAAKEVRNAYQREWFKKNRAKANVYQKKWRTENPEKKKELDNRYWERKALAAPSAE